jgi:hypothetical protein
VVSGSTVELNVSVLVGSSVVVCCKLVLIGFITSDVGVSVVVGAGVIVMVVIGVSIVIVVVVGVSVVAVSSVVRIPPTCTEALAVV